MLNSQYSIFNSKPRVLAYGFCLAPALQFFNRLNSIPTRAYRNRPLYPN